MTLKNIPVIILDEVLLFPSVDLRLDFDSNYIQEVINISEKYFNGEIFIAFKEDPLEEEISVDELLSVGIIANITSKLELPNKKIRITFHGIKRAKLKELYEEEHVLHAKVKMLLSSEVTVKEEIAYLRILKNMLSEYTKNSPFSIDSLFNIAKNTNELDTFTNILSFTFSLPNPRKQEYLLEVNPIERAKMLIEDIRQDFEILTLEKQIDEEVGRRIDKTQQEFILREKIKVIREKLGETHDIISEASSYLEKLPTLGCSKKIEAKLKMEISKLETISASSPEVAVIKNYLDLMFSLPFKDKTDDVTDLLAIENKLAKNHYGLEEIKDRILEYIAVKNYADKNNDVDNDDSAGDVESPILCFVGPPGVGKTSLAKSIATSLNRKYVKISVGGIKDQADIVGHRKTYVGAYPGMIIEGMRKSGVTNPVFLIDEIDKMQRGIYGDPASSLLEVLDRNQNKKFIDHYIEEEYDLSDVLFIATANYIDQIPVELLDRLEIIELSSYTVFEKIEILKQHIIPLALKRYNLKKKEIVFDDDILFYIVDRYTKEAGVREVERLILKILRKYIKDKLLKNEKKLVLTKDNINYYLGNEIYDYEKDNDSYKVGVVNGLSYTMYGGDTLKIEATLYKGNGNLILTGSLGEVMRESATVCLSYIRANSNVFGINKDVFQKNDIHIHLEETAVKKEGPSAGIALTTVLISILTGKVVPNFVAMTGEMTLRGAILPIGGVREKVIGAYKEHIKKIYLPSYNKKDVLKLNIPEIKDIDFIYVDDYIEVYNDLFKDNIIDFSKGIEHIKLEL